MTSTPAAAPRRALPGRWLASQCLVCRRWERSVICSTCLSRHAEGRMRCRGCAIALAGPAGGGELCPRCRHDPPAFDAAVAALDYAFPWDRLIGRFKFHDAVGLAGPFADLLAEAIRAAWPGGVERADLVLPVPLTPERLRERGYNQAWELARRVARILDVEADSAVTERLVGGPHQAQLQGADRRRQVRGAFAVRAGQAARLAGRRVAIVDDVMTTGATLSELAVTLRQAGAVGVQAWVLARTPED